MSKKKITKKNNNHQELEDRLKRTLADYQNLERRIEEERKMLSRLSSVLLIEKFLPVLENLENAQKHLNDQGLELVIKQFKEVLASEGVEEIEAEDKQFDPKYHEAIEAEPGEIENRITKVLTKGYKIEDKVIKPSRVVVTKTQSQTEDTSHNQGGEEMTTQTEN